jgi:UDP-glucose 4-epimerase
VRDFIHVADLADAHGRAVEYLLEGGESAALNLGTGTGTTVQELLATVRDVSGRPFTIRREGRRAGDAPVLVADNAKAAATLGWAPRHDLNSIVRTAWDWHSRGNLAAAE